MSKSFKFNIIIYTTFYLLIMYFIEKKIHNYGKKSMFKKKNPCLKKKIHVKKKKSMIKKKNPCLKKKIHDYGKKSMFMAIHFYGSNFWAI